jgi:hypothetical protein
MKYTPEQITEIFLKVLKEVNTPDVSKLSRQERKDLARNPNTPPEVLTILARDEDYWVRCGVARSPNTPPETLTILARDKDWGVRCGVAWNPNTPPEILTFLARDEDWNVRCRVAENPNTPPEILTVLAQDEDWCVRTSAQRNPNYNPVKELKVTAKQYEALKALLAASQDENLKSIQF